MGHLVQIEVSDTAKIVFPYVFIKSDVFMAEKYIKISRKLPNDFPGNLKNPGTKLYPNGPF